MKRKAVSTIMLILLLACLTDPAIMNLTAKATGGIGADVDWCMFHLDTSHTGSSNLTIPTPLSQIWSNSTNGPIRSSPAVVGGEVFVGSDDGSVHVFNATDGSKLDKGTLLTAAYNFTTGDRVESSPAVDNIANMVFVGSDDKKVYAWNKTRISYGQTSVRWTYLTGGPVRSSPTVANGRVFVGSDDGYVYALDETTTNSTGKLLWKFWTAYPVYSSPAFCDNRVFVSASDGRVYALNFTGRCEWFVDARVNCSSPAVADGKVFVGATNGTIYALDENNGTTLWYNTTGGAIESCPAVGNGMVFVGSLDNRTYAFNETDGNQIWNYTTGGPVYSSPAFADGKVFVGSSDTKLYVLNATDVTSPLQDPLATSGVIYSSPAIAKDGLGRPCLYIGSLDQTIYAFTTENTAPQVGMSSFPAQPYILQTINFNGWARASPPYVIANLTWNFGDGTLLASTDLKDLNTAHAYAAAGTYDATLAVTDNYPIPTQRKTSTTWQLVNVSEAWPMYRHDWSHTGYSTSFAPITNMSLLWSATIGPPVTDTSLYPSPAVVNGTVYAASYSSTNGTVFALNASDGSTKWSRPNLAADPILSSPAFADGMIFIGSDDQKVYALNATDGTTIWTSLTGGKVESSPVVAYNKVFVGSGGILYAFDENTGNQSWSNGTGGIIDSSPAVADHMVFIGSWDGYAYAFNATNGNQIWKTINRLSDKIESSPAVANGFVFIGASNGTFYCLNETNGNVIWSSSTGGGLASSAAVDGKNVFIESSDGKIHAFYTNGTSFWNQTIGPAEQTEWSSPAVGGGIVFIGSRNGKIYALNESDGSVMWSFQIDGAVDSSVAILNNRLYASSKNGTLYAFYNEIHDVAITNVVASSPVLVNQTVTITASLENLGTFDENDVTVTAQYDSSLFYSNSFNLTQGEVLPLQIPWDTTGVSSGYHTICVNATFAAGEVDNNTPNNYGTCLVMVTSGGHNIAIMYATTSKAGCKPVPTVCLNYTCNVTVTVENHGGYDETFNVTGYANDTATANVTSISTFNVTLATGTSTNLTLVWNTTGFAKGNYTISAYAEPVQGETNTADNVRTADGIVKVTIVGDVNGDGKVNLIDVFSVALAYGSYPGPPPWNPNCDINNDGKINLIDYFTTALNYGKTDP